MSRRPSSRQAAVLRATLVPLVASGRAVCWRCLEPIRPDEPWDAGHLDDIARGGDPLGRVEPEHRTCNRRAGGALRVELARAPSRVRLRRWLARGTDA